MTKKRQPRIERFGDVGTEFIAPLEAAAKKPKEVDKPKQSEK